MSVLVSGTAAGDQAIGQRRESLFITPDEVPGLFRPGGQARRESKSRSVQRVPQLLFVGVVELGKGGDTSIVEGSLHGGTNAFDSLEIVRVDRCETGHFEGVEGTSVWPADWLDWPS
jgi:hypothetical protein